MPIYEYRCKKGHNFDVRQHFSDDPVTECEVCSAPAQRVFRPIAVHFKGSGFYNTDYGTRKRSREMKEHKEASKSEAAKSEGSKDSGSKSESTATKTDSGSQEVRERQSPRHRLIPLPAARLGRGAGAPASAVHQRRHRAVHGAR